MQMLQILKNPRSRESRPPLNASGARKKPSALERDLLLTILKSSFLLLGLFRHWVGTADVFTVGKLHC